MAAAVLIVLAAPAAAHAFTIVGTEAYGGWWSKDTVVEFAPGEVWTITDDQDKTELSGIGGSVAAASLHEGGCDIQSFPTPDTVQTASLFLDFTPPTSGSFKCQLSSSGCSGPTATSRARSTTASASSFCCTTGTSSG